MNVENKNGVAVVTMHREKVNAFNAQAVQDMVDCFGQLEEDVDTKAVVLTGHGKFFSFGFDVPELLTYSRETLTLFLTEFTRLQRKIFLFPKPLIAVLNGHTTAGGCMLATCGDYRYMVSENSRISLNEINIGVPVFAIAVEILKFCVGTRNAELILTSGEMYLPDQALQVGLVDTLHSAERLMAEGMRLAVTMAEKNAEAFQAIKMLLRKPVADAAAAREEAAISRFVEIWFSERTQEQLKTVRIRR